jgi:hypothetical protein
MNDPRTIDGVLVQWGDRLFYPRNKHAPAGQGGLRLGAAGLQERAATIRRRITSTVVGRAPQVMVKVTGGGRGMGAISAHLRYISKNGQLLLEDDRGLAREGREELRDLVEQWRLGGSHIPETSPRREAFNLMLSMPAGTKPQFVQSAAREFAKAELANHRYVMVLHTHQANPHVHLAVRAEGRDGQRLNPRKEDLRRWRGTFAEKLRGWGIEAEASSQATRGTRHRNQRVWQRRPPAISERPRQEDKTDSPSRVRSLRAWFEVGRALAASPDASDRKLSAAIVRFVREAPAMRELIDARAKQRVLPGIGRGPQPSAARSRPGPERSR